MGVCLPYRKSGSKHVIGFTTLESAPTHAPRVRPGFEESGLSSSFSLLRVISFRHSCTYCVNILAASPCCEEREREGERDGGRIASLLVKAAVRSRRDGKGESVRCLVSGQLSVFVHASVS